MAAKPEEKYDPGELTRTKINLGKISEDEAKRMSRILGGEIGTEKTGHSINERYQELSKQNKKNREDKWISQKPYTSTTDIDKKANKPIKYGSSGTLVESIHRI